MLAFMNGVCYNTHIIQKQRKEIEMKKTYFGQFFDNPEDLNLLTIEINDVKFSMELTEERMKKLVSACVKTYGLEAVMKAAVE